MLCVSRLSTGRACLLILGIALLTESVIGLTMLSEPAWAATSRVASRAGAHVSARDSRHRTDSRSSRSPGCVTVTRQRRRLEGKGCTKKSGKAVSRPKAPTRGAKPVPAAILAPIGEPTGAGEAAPVSEPSPIEPTPIVEPAEPSEPIPIIPTPAEEPAKPADPPTPGAPVSPTQPVQPSELAPQEEPNPTEPTWPTEPGSPSELGEPVENNLGKESEYPVETPPTEKLPTAVGKRATTTTTLLSSLNPSTVGEPVTYTATVSPAAGTGTVEFQQVGTTIPGCAAQVISAGTAKCTVTDLAAGWPWITAIYSGDSNYAVSWSASLTQAVMKKTTTTTVSSSLDPSAVSEVVTFTARISTAAATGTVEFKQAGAPISGCAAKIASSGIATCTVTNLVAGEHLVKAVYSGDSRYGGSTSSGVAQTVNKKTTTTTVASSLDPSTVSQAVTYTATVSAAAATGTVSFNEAGAPITGCTARTVSSGAATCAVAGPTAGGHGITAVYSGNSNYAASRSPVLTQTVNRKTAITTISSSSNPSTVGQVVTFTATVSAAAATGTVEFKQAGATISGCAAQAVSSGIATCTVANLAVGWPGVTAVYSGDGGYAASWSPNFTQTVNKRTVATTVSSSLNPSAVGQAVTYTATVNAAAATGTVEFKEGGAPITGCIGEPISSGTATCTVTGYSKWSSYNVTAAYSGDSSDLASVSSTFTQTVEPPAESATPFRFFSPAGLWNAALSATTPLDPSSANVVGALDAEVAKELEIQKGPAINTTCFSVPIFTVAAEQQTVKVTLENSSKNPTLQAAWDAVPLPPNAKPAAGTDKHLVVWQPSTDKLWEFWRLGKTETGWEAAWGGAIQNASSDSGAYGPEAWPGANTGWGASAASLSIAGGLITLEDLEKGVINHALAIAAPNTRDGVFASPAQRTDGQHTEASSLPEGAHLRLESKLNLASLHLPRLTLMMAVAAQRYGIIVRDTASNVAFYAQDPTPTGTEPYTGLHGYYEGKSSSQILAAFPWSHLQLLKMELHGAP